jgi:hypothetical protein
MSKKRAIVLRIMVLALIALPATMQSQQQGNVAIYNSGSPAASSAYIDAGPFYNNGLGTSGDICKIINGILSGTLYSNYPPAGAVIDARGILPLANEPAYLSCSINPFPSSAPPSTILLPGETIQIAQPWVLPSNTRIIGEGSGISGSVTAIGPQSSFSRGTYTALIQMGVSNSTPATGVVIEHLQVNVFSLTNGNNNTNIDAIDNVSAGDGSYVNDVDIINFGPLTSGGSLASGSQCTPTTGVITGLCISPNATYSGPYTNINLAPSNNCSSGNYMCQNTACVKIQAQTRGLHNLTCVGGSTGTNNTTWPKAAIYLDSYATSIENVHIEGFYDGIVVGDYADGLPTGASSISGDTIATGTGSYNSGGELQNTVHICNASVSSPNSACRSASLPVTNLTITQSLASAGTTGGNTAIQDDNANGGTFGVSTSTQPGFVGLYSIGAPGTITISGGNVSTYSRFTTTDSAAVSWSVGVPSSSIAGQSCQQSGSIFSATNGQGGSNDTIYICTKYGNNGSLKWTALGD